MVEAGCKVACTALHIRKDLNLYLKQHTPNMTFCPNLKKYQMNHGLLPADLLGLLAKFPAWPA